LRLEVAVRETLASPVLVGRDELLALADRRIEQSGAGRGHLLFLSGEAGGGKTRLLGSISRRAERSDFTVLRAAAFPGDAETSGGVLLDLAGDLRRSAGAGAQAIGVAISERLRDPLGGDGDPHRRRRLLVQDLADALANLDPGRRLLLVLEDLHWADQLSLDVLRHFASRLETRAALVVCAFRSDELYPGTPIREWRSRLLSQRLAEEARVPRLTPAQTATLISAVLARPAPAQLVAAIHERSDGIPLHVEELLAAAADSLDPYDLTVPDTLADAVLARAQVLDQGARDLAGAAAVIGRRFDFDLLTTVSEADPADVDRSLRGLQALYLVQAGADDVTFDFRHALIRDALYGEVPLPRRRELHERVALAAVERGYPDSFVSAHFDQARLAAPAYRYAVLGGDEAANVSARREALQLYRRALRNMPPDTGDLDHALLLSAIGDEAAAVDENAEAAQAYASAHGLYTRTGERRAAAALVPGMVAVGHLLGEDLDHRVGRLQAALASIEDLTDAEPVRARLVSGLAAAYMLDRRLDESLAYGSCTVEIAAATDDPAVLNTGVTQGSVLLFAGRMESGWNLLETAISRSAALLQEAEAARGFRMIGSCASVLVEYDRAEKWLSEGIAYAEAVELWNHRSYMAGHLAHVQWACGDWAAAEQTAGLALADGRGGITTRITALYVLGYIATGRGDWPAATELLTEALELGESMAELQRFSPPLWGLAEMALLRGDHETSVSLCDKGFQASGEVSDAAYLFPFLVTGTRARLARQDREGAVDWVARVEEALQHRQIPGTLPAITHARGLLQLAAGEVEEARVTLRAAHSAWTGRRRFWEAAWAGLDEAHCALAGRRVVEAGPLADTVRAEAARVGATTLVTAADELLAGPRARGAKPWHPLTEREWSVATLVAVGMTNRQIATELFLAPKTVSSHVEHILAKLGAARRAEIAAWAARVEV
jgi:ATP/maltotriose-dependent transcriptional regulator MalT